MCRLPLSLASFEQIWRGPDFEHRPTYYCEGCNLRFGTEPYQQAEPIPSELKQWEEQITGANDGWTCPFQLIFEPNEAIVKSCKDVYSDDQACQVLFFMYLNCFQMISPLNR